MADLRVVLMGSDIELRLVSLIVRAREIADDVLLMDTGSSDGTIALAKKVECDVISFDANADAPSLAKALLEHDDSCNILIVKIDGRFKLRDLPLLVNRAREKWDVHLSFIGTTADENINPQNVVYQSGKVSHLAASIEGLVELSKASTMAAPFDLPDNLRVRVLTSKPLPKMQQRESLASASRFARLFYWMLETRHPLIMFGIPGAILFIVGYKLSGNVLDTFSEWNQSTIGAGFAVIGVTLMGLFAMMVGLILYIMGKQVKQMQAQYDDLPKR